MTGIYNMCAFYTNVATVGNNVLLRCVDDNGKRKKLKIPYQPKLYVPSKNPTKFKTLFGESLEELEFEGLYKARDFQKRYEGVDNFKIYGMNRFDYAFISEVFSDEMEWDFSKINIAYIDLEVSSDNGFPQPDEAREPLTAITLHLNGKFHVFGFKDYKVQNEDQIYYQFESEIELLNKFLDVWSENMPDIVSGWSSNIFDFPYLINRMKKLGMEDKTIGRLSPWGIVSEREIYIKGSDKQKNGYSILGVALMDYLDLYKKFSAHPNQPSYKLNEIGFVEVKTRKVDYHEYGTLHNLYKKNPQLYIEYNIFDVEIVRKLEAKLKLLELAMTLAYDSKVNFEDVFYQVRMWDSIIYNHLKKKNIIIPPKNKSSKTAQYKGAYVKEPKPGYYKWVVSFDLTSLYPHLIMMYNISPETLVTNKIKFDSNKISVDTLLNKQIDLSFLKDNKVTLTPNGQLFTLENLGFLSELMDTMYQDRARYKKIAIEAKKELEKTKDPVKREELENKISRYNNLQQAKKVCLNSAYGTIGNSYFRFFDVRIAEAVTLSGQLSATWIEKKINEKMNELFNTNNKDFVIASDTDSIYLMLEEYINPFQNQGLDNKALIAKLNDFCNDTIQPFIDECYKELTNYVNAYSQKMLMKREVLADQGIWTGKKHYLLNVYDSEGVVYANPEVKVVGLEGIKSSTPNASRAKLNEAYKIIMHSSEEELRSFVNAFREEFKTLPITEISFPKSVNGFEKYRDLNEVYKHGAKTPAHTKGALYFNHFLKTLDLTKKYEEIKEGEKIKYFYIKEPNPKQCPILAITTILPDEFDLTRFIDYNVQFEKSFITPLTPVVDARGWKLKKQSTINNIFDE